jgi:hypothetical protein
MQPALITTVEGLAVEVDGARCHSADPRVQAAVLVALKPLIFGGGDWVQANGQTVDSNIGKLFELGALEAALAAMSAHAAEYTTEYGARCTGGGGGQRHWNDPMLVTTYPHIVVALCASSNTYAGIVMLSTTFSILWHRHREPDGLLFIIDHSFACLWGLADICLNPYTLMLNIPVAIANQYMDHRLWHLLHVTKALFIASFMV